MARFFDQSKVNMDYVLEGDLGDEGFSAQIVGDNIELNLISSASEDHIQTSSAINFMSLWNTKCTIGSTLNGFSGTIEKDLSEKLIMTTKSDFISHFS